METKIIETRKCYRCGKRYNQIQKCLCLSPQTKRFTTWEKFCLGLVGIFFSFMSLVFIGAMIQLNKKIERNASIVHIMSDETYYNDNYYRETVDSNGGDYHHVNPHYVNGYYRSDGTYVNGYWRGGSDGYLRGNPDGNSYNNIGNGTYRGTYSDSYSDPYDATDAAEDVLESISEFFD